MRRIWLVAMLALLLGACGSGSGTDVGQAGETSGGDERTVLVDYRHDEFTSAFLRYYPEQLKVRPGDTVHFKQAWTGEPHSVTMGKIVDDIFEFLPVVEKYNSADEALADGVPQETVDRVTTAFSKLPGMTAGSYEVFQPGAQPCFIDDIDDIPAFSDPKTDEPNKDATCPTKGRRQPAFRGGEGLYNSGFIAPDGPKANTFLIPIARDAKPGTYKYFCNYHFLSMSGSIEIVEPKASIPSQTAVSRQARKEIAAQAKVAISRVKEANQAKAGKIGELSLPLAGRDVSAGDGRDGPGPGVIINQFLPAKVTAKVGEKVTWTFDGATHTVSFNVPKYFPIFSAQKDGTVSWNPKSHEPVGFDVPAQESQHQEERPPAAKIDAGTWDGKGGFHSSGALNPGDSFSVAFSKSGTYSYACVLHPQMVGTLVVK